jgi:MOSC domain-containing protein YiiM
MSGTLLQLNAKPKIQEERGLPKTAVAELRVTSAGAEGDYNRWRTESAAGDPDQAILVMTREVLNGLVRDGWPVKPGDLGENFTLDGIAESALQPGVRLRAGPLLLEVTKACDPCDVVYSLPYIGKERGPEFVRALVGRRGWYAKVLEGGVVTMGSAINVVPA